MNSQLNRLYKDARKQKILMAKHSHLKNTIAYTDYDKAEEKYTKIKTEIKILVRKCEENR